MTGEPGCLWCGRPFEPGHRGKPQRYCSAAHRRAYDQAARDWVRLAIAAGLLTMADIQMAYGKTRAFPGAVSKPDKAR